MMVGAESSRHLPCARQGLAQLTVSEVAGLSVATQFVSRTPLKLLVPQPRGRSVWAYLSSFGGGLLAGDTASINLEVSERARAFLTSQSATKVYTSPHGLPARQHLSCAIDDGAFLAVVPDPVQCFAGSVYEQRQIFQIAKSSGLVFLDALSAGRTACDERWAFTKFHSRTEIFVDENRACLDSLLLDNRARDSAAAMGRFNSFATLALVGDLVAAPAQALLAAISQRPVPKRGGLVVSASEIRHGILIRAAAQSLETLTTELRHYLNFLADFLGDDPLARKW